LKDAQPARCVARAALPDDSSLADLVRVGLGRAGSARDGCLVALRADDPFAPAVLPDDYSAPVDCSGQGGSVARDLRPDARLQPVE
jgi:hypothetical protein